jgi:hypothetical protein
MVHRVENDRERPAGLALGQGKGLFRGSFGPMHHQNGLGL